MAENKDISILQGAGYAVYPESCRPFKGSTLYVVRKDDRKYLAIDGPDLPSCSLVATTGSWRIHELDWDTYLAIGIKPSPISKPASFGTGDRLGLVTAAHLSVHGRYPVFPILAQQSPRELERTDRTFKGVLLDAVMGILESGYEGSFGADADHVKDPVRLMEGIEAGYSMFTLDLSDNLQPTSGRSLKDLSTLSRDVVDRLAKNPTYSKDGLTESALIYEKSMESCVNSYQTIQSDLPEFDLEVSIDEGDRDTTLEDHAFVAGYLHRAGVVFTSLAPRFPGEFQKAIDYKGDLLALTKSFEAHARLAADGGYRLSLHSGSDKFSVYPAFAKATDGLFHIKTSGTSWLQAVRVVAEINPSLFNELYSFAREMLDESRKAYHVDIRQNHFSPSIDGDPVTFYNTPIVQQLIHISYGVLLARYRQEIEQTLHLNEERHYRCVAEHIERHHRLLFGG